MEKIYFHLEYCYGIKHFQYTIQFDDIKKAHLIYAPNGTMKSSFARALQDISKGAITQDAMFPERQTIRIVKHQDKDGEDYQAGEIFVVEPYNSAYKSDRMSMLLADQTLKSEYDELLAEIEKRMAVVSSQLARMSSKRDAIKIFLKDFDAEASDIHELLLLISEDEELKSVANYQGISYSKLFSPEGEEVLKQPDVNTKLQAYLDQYKQLITSSSVFREVFDHSSAKTVLIDLARSGFFKAQHKVLLDGDNNGRDEKEFETIIEEEKRRIIDVAMSDVFSDLDRILDKKSGTRELRAYLNDHREILPELANIADFKKKLWASYLFSNEEALNEAILYYKRSRVRIAEIIDQARQQESVWHQITDKFNRRFIDLPYTLEVSNRDAVILREQAPTLVFRFKSSNEEKEVERDLLLQYLSDGEKRALYLLNIIFELSTRQTLREKSIVVFDDVSDSFDYKNKYAIIEYLIDIIESKSFFPIILTHNFDFYRTLACRAGIKSSSWFAEKTAHGIKIEEGEYFEDVFTYWKSKVYNSAPIMISAIAFFRNIEQYQYGNESDIYRQLTALLHYKKNDCNSVIATERFLIGQLCDFLIGRWGLDKDKLTFDRTLSTYEFIIESARTIANCIEDSLSLEKKVTLAIACRLMADKYMIARIDDDTVTDNINGNQTRVLRNMITIDQDDPADIERGKVIDRVLIISSENIHINAFMYEPIIDIALNELKDLFNQVSKFLVVKV